jgi:hypothetical protein
MLVEQITCADHMLVKLEHIKCWWWHGFEFAALLALILVASLVQL